MYVTDTGVYTRFQIPVGSISVQEFPFKIWIGWIINLIFLVQETGVHKKPFFIPSFLIKTQPCYKELQNSGTYCDLE